MPEHNDYYFVESPETILDHISDPSNLRKSLVDGDKTLNMIAQMRQFADDTSTITSHGRVAGHHKDLKLIANVPESLLIVALAVEPNLLKDKKKLYRWLDANPHFYAYTRVKRGKA